MHHFFAEVVARGSMLKLKELPPLKSRESSDGKVGAKAAHAFNIAYEHNPVYPGYIMGKLHLPRKGVKVAENVGSCAQTFTILKGQRNSIEVAFADPRNMHSEKMNPVTAHRFLLEPGDVFRVPPGNTYRLQNHSKLLDCDMTWTIIRPTHAEQMEGT
jgi:centromere protein C